jgi:hypothetical protein
LISLSPHGDEGAGIGLPAKSRAPAVGAGWAPRISRTPGYGARLFSLQDFFMVRMNRVENAKNFHHHS